MNEGDMAMMMTPAEIEALNADHEGDMFAFEESAAATTLRVARDAGLEIRKAASTANGNWWLFMAPSTGRWVYGWECGGFSASQLADTRD